MKPSITIRSIRCKYLYFLYALYMFFINFFLMVLLLWEGGYGFVDAYIKYFFVFSAWAWCEICIIWVCLSQIIYIICDTCVFSFFIIIFYACMRGKNWTQVYSGLIGCEICTYFQLFFILNIYSCIINYVYMYFCVWILCVYFYFPFLAEGIIFLNTWQLFYNKPNVYFKGVHDGVYYTLNGSVKIFDFDLSKASIK